MKGIELRIKGKVQGVGFRPFVWLIANEYGLKGWPRRTHPFYRTRGKESYCFSTGLTDKTSSFSINYGYPTARKILGGFTALFRICYP